MKDLALKLFPFAAFLAFLIKCVVISPTLADSIIFCALVAYILLDSMRLTNKQTQEFKKTVENFQLQLDEMKNDIKNTQNNLNGVKLGMGVKSLMPHQPKNG